MPRFINIQGEMFGRLRVLRLIGRNRHGSAKWSCRCECGQTVVRTTSDLRAGRRWHCGCQTPSHGQARTGKSSPEHQAWVNMRQRCVNPKNRNWKHYGGRGIRVCERWASFENFFADVGRRPSDEHTLERKNNDKNYEPDNCVWATQKQQSRNTRRNRLLTYQDQTMPLVAWAESLGLKFATLHARIVRLGWTVERALTTPSAGRSF